MKQLFYENIDDKTVSRNIALYTLNKATKNNNTRAISNSYIRLYATYYNDLEKGKLFLDSSIVTSIKYKHNDLLAEGYFLRGNLFYRYGKDEKAINDFLKARKFVDREKEIYYKILYNIGVIKLDIEETKEALAIFKKCYEHYLSQIQGNDYDFIETLYGLSVAHINLKEYDLASKHAKEGYMFSRSINDSSYFRFTYIEGNNQFLKGNFIAAKDSLYKSLNYLKESDDLQNLSIAYFYLGKVYREEGNKIKMINYFKKVDSIFDETNYVYHEVRPSYEYIIKFYKNKNDIKQQLYYVNKLLIVDSLINNRFRKISKNIYKEFDRKNLVQEKNKLEISLGNSKKKSLYSTILFVLIITIISIILYFNFSRNNKQKIKFEELLKKLENENTPDELNVKKVKVIENKKQNLDIDQEVVDSILNKLEEFEKDNHYIQKGLNVALLAKQCNTNSKYLSKVINIYKEKTFRSYVNDLRIDYTVKKIKSDGVFRNYTIRAIADEVGFSNSESYAKAFYKRTGIHTSYFIKKVKNVQG
ncbi:hypothetical protein H2O64_02590 [Kordia sp. YSTF-M3]|uniref:HTH araC/xylS-type domain-containing protein n=1 Tax=Kordia aestuariivivens TaxID=2759037 RepID=A0ABR7Q4Q5_9FLAO|nr:hypothetical protein [Kordia aestuariivivens]MBC8753542.1 hypothetical protein [Kordia aestuariivivens]